MGFYDEETIVPLAAAARAYEDATHESLKLPDSDDLIDFLPPAGQGFAAASKIAAWLAQAGESLSPAARLATAKAQLLVPIPNPKKLFLLAGNYADHIQEGGGIAAERAETFLKPGDTLSASIGSIGTLVSPVVGE